MPAHKSGKNNRKWRRNEAFCLKYEQCGRREINKVKKQVRHHKLHPNDAMKSAPVNYTRKSPLGYFEALFAPKENKFTKRLDK